MAHILKLRIYHFWPNYFSKLSSVYSICRTIGLSDYSYGPKKKCPHISRHLPDHPSREHFWCISCEKITILRQQNHIFSNFRGGARRGRPPPPPPPPLNPPLILNKFKFNMPPFLHAKTQLHSTCQRNVKQ